MNIRFYLALVIARLAFFMARLSGRGKGSSLPGSLALKIYPAVLGELARQVGLGVIMVTGTNGKTTTNNMIAGILKADGHTVLINQEGANLITGVTAAFIKNASLWGRLKCDYACLEVDEASFPGVCSWVKPSLVVVTNFFRDQLDRYGELDKTIALVGEALKKQNKDDFITAQVGGNINRGNKKLRKVDGSPILVLNADDPLVAQLGSQTGLGSFYFGLAQHAGVSLLGAASREGKYCPFCGEELRYSYYHYSQLGNYSCPGCSFGRPAAQVEGFGPRSLGTAVSCALEVPGGASHSLTIPLSGLYNLYNAMAAFSIGLLLKVAPDIILGSLGQFKTVLGRMDRFIYRGKPVLLNLVKNPTGFNEGLASVLNPGGAAGDVLLAINDNAADGRDISWLWDVDFEILEEWHHLLHSFVCTGTRAGDMAVRLKYAGVPLQKIKVVEHYEDAIKEVLLGEGQRALLLATYTALWPLERILTNYAHREEAGAEHLPSVS